MDTYSFWSSWVQSTCPWWRPSVCLWSGSRVANSGVRSYSVLNSHYSHAPSGTPSHPLTPFPNQNQKFLKPSLSHLLPSSIQFWKALVKSTWLHLRILGHLYHLENYYSHPHPLLTKIMKISNHQTKNHTSAQTQVKKLERSGIFQNIINNLKSLIEKNEDFKAVSVRLRWGI